MKTMQAPSIPFTFKCPKCAGSEYEQGKAYMSGGFWSKIFDVQGKRFDTASCKQCGYTEFYKKEKRKGENVLDFFTG